MAKKKVLSHARLNVMLRELRSIRDTCIPEDANGAEDDMKDLDDFQKAKARLSKHLHELKTAVDDYNDLRNKKQGQRDVRLIGMHSDNEKRLREATNLWCKLKVEFEKNIQRSKLDHETLASRQKFLELYAKELEQLAEANSSNGPKSKALDATSRAMDRNKKARTAREERRRQRKERKAQAGIDGAPDSDEEAEAGGQDEQMQQFMEEKAQKDHEIDDLLDVITAGMSELKAIGVDIQTNLQVTGEMLNSLDQKMDQSVENYVTANKRLKDLMDQATGGIGQWCPVLLCFIVLLGLVGYPLHIA